MIGSSSGSSAIDCSLGSSMLLLWYAAIFYQIVLLLILLKTDVLFYIVFSKRISHLTIRGKKMKKNLHDTDAKCYTEN